MHCSGRPATLRIRGTHVLFVWIADDLEEAEREEEAKLQAQAEREAGEWLIVECLCCVSVVCVELAETPGFVC